jgi:hypothetical protein
MKGAERKVETISQDSIEDYEIRYRRLFTTSQDGILILEAAAGYAILQENGQAVAQLFLRRRHCLPLWRRRIHNRPVAVTLLLGVAVYPRDGFTVERS